MEFSKSERYKDGLVVAKERFGATCIYLPYLQPCIEG